MALTFVVLSTDNEASRLIKAALSAGSNTRLVAEAQTPERLLSDVQLLRPSGVILVLSQAPTDAEFGMVKKIGSTYPGTAVITASTNSSSSVILRSIRSGAHEFLPLPINAEEFRTVMERVQEFQTVSEESMKKLGRLVAIFSGKGGAGASFLATNLAAAMTVPTLLVDLNLQAGDAASFLGIDARFSIADLVNNRSRLDDGLIQSFLTVQSPGLSLLAAPPEAHEAEDIKPQDVTEILHLLRQRFDCVVIDLPHTFDSTTVAALDASDNIINVLTLDIPSIRSTNRALKVFNRLGYPRSKIHLVVNRWGKNIDVQLQKVESHLDEQIIGLIPNDYRKVMDSINLGKPLVQSDPSSKITTEIKRIAALVSGEGDTTPTQARKGLLRGMFNRNSATGGTGSLQLSPMMDKA
jgi:pilus assembly protein CpaE